MHLLSSHKDADYVQDILFYIYRIFLPLMLSNLLSFSSYSNPTSDLHTSWIESTFSTCLRTQLQNLYSDALNDIELLPKTSYFQLNLAKKTISIWGLKWSS